MGVRGCGAGVLFRIIIKNRIFGFGRMEGGCSNLKCVIEKEKEKNRWLKFTAKSRKHLSTRVRSSKTGWIWSSGLSQLNLMKPIYCQQYTFINWVHSLLLFELLVELAKISSFSKHVFLYMRVQSFSKRFLWFKNLQLCFSSLHIRDYVFRCVVMSMYVVFSGGAECGEWVQSAYWFFDLLRPTK